MGEIIDVIVDIIRTFIDIIRRIIVKVINYAKHIVAWIKDKIKQHKKDPSKKILSVKITENINSGNFNEVNIGLSSKTDEAVANVVFDTDTNSILDYEENAELIEAENGMDNETLKRFKGKNMIVHKS